MELETDGISRLPGLFARPDQVFGKYLLVRLDADGKILGMESHENIFFASLGRELEKAGNIKAFFDFSPYPSLDKVPELADPASIGKDPFKNRVFVVFMNSRDFPREEYPELFFTTVPTALLSVCRTGQKEYCGIIRTIQTIPEIYLERSNGIILVDRKEKLSGFNHTFYEFFEHRFKEPLSMLKKPVSEFLNPTPFQVQSDKLRHYVPADELSFETVYTLDQGNLVFSKKGCDRTTPGGLVLDNPDAETLYCRLPVRLNTRLDFRIEIEAENIKAEIPLITLGREDTFSDFPDRYGYLAGADYRRGRYILKRKGLINVIGDKARPGRRTRLCLQKSGSALRFYVSGREMLAFYDSNFLHTENGMVSFGLRQGGACLISQVSVKCARESVFLEDVPTVIKLNTPAQHYFVLNRLNIINLAINYPQVSAYVLENVTEIQKKVNALESQFQAAGGLDFPDNPFSGPSPLMEAIRQKAGLVAESDATVLIQGATGTGKEVLAHYIHNKSLRKAKPFIKVDLSTIPQSLAESELFGHERGAFTGAHERKIGFFEQADQGTLFLDEVANLSAEAQKKLLQFLQDHKITRVGGTAPVTLNVRVIVAANVPLATLVEKGAFRADLYYRIDVVSIFLPPLKERKEDVPALARLFIAEMDRKHGRNVKGLSPAALEKIMTYDWPGNIRELKNAVERAVIFCRGDEIRSEQVQFSEIAGPDKTGGRKTHQFIRTDIEEVRRLFKKHGGRAKAVARELNIAPRTLYYQIKRAGCSVESVRTGAST